MTAAQFRRALARLHLSQQATAALLCVDERTVRRWALHERAIPGPVRAALEAWLRHGLPLVSRHRSDHTESGNTA